MHTKSCSQLCDSSIAATTDGSNVFVVRAAMQSFCRCKMKRKRAGYGRQRASADKGQCESMREGGGGQLPSFRKVCSSKPINRKRNFFDKCDTCDAFFAIHPAFSPHMIPYATPCGSTSRTATTQHTRTLARHFSSPAPFSVSTQASAVNLAGRRVRGDG